LTSSGPAVPGSTWLSLHQLTQGADLAKVAADRLARGVAVGHVQTQEASEGVI